MQTHTILLAEDDPFQRQLMTKLLSAKLGYQVVAVENGKQAVAELNKQNHDAFSAILLDVEMPHMDGLEVLEHIHARHSHVPSIMLTSNTKAETVVKAVKLGAFDYLSKPADPTQLQVTLNNAIRMHGIARELARIRRNKEGQLSFSDLVGYDGGLAASVAIGRKAAKIQAPVLITGETGTGKELFARAVHGESARAGQAFVAINCGAIPEKLVESILFGHEKGAFTGATEKTLGKFREAEGGTIFLDELGELPLDIQVKLLRVLQEGEITPVGGVPVKVDARIISATNQQLDKLVADKTFREDLYFRLNVLPIELPPLKARGSDAILLAEYFLERAALEDNNPLKKLAASARQYILHCAWPGNIRELANLMRRASIWCDGGTLHDSDLIALNPSSETAIQLPKNPAQASDGVMLLHSDGTHKTIDEIEKEVMQAVLMSQGGNIAQAAEKLGIAKSTFYRKIKQVKLQTGTL